MPKYCRLYLSGDMRGADALGLSMVACLSGRLWMKPIVMLGDDHWKQLANASKSPERLVKELIIRCGGDGDAIGTMVKMTSTVIVYADHFYCGLILDAIRNMQGGRCQQISFRGENNKHKSINMDIHRRL